MLKAQFTAIYQKRGRWYVGWVEEMSGVNTQGRTLAETRANLQEALSLIVEVNRALSKKALSGRYVRETLALV